MLEGTLLLVFLAMIFPQNMWEITDGEISASKKVHPKTLSKIKLENVIAVLILSLFLAVVMYCIGFKIEIL